METDLSLVRLGRTEQYSIQGSVMVLASMTIEVSVIKSTYVSDILLSHSPMVSSGEGAMLSYCVSCLAYRFLL